MSKVFVKDLVVFITGSSKPQGIGRALALEAIQRGAKKVYATARNVRELDDLVAQFKGKVVALELDVTNLKQIQIVAQKACDTQVLINNAGVTGFSGCAFNYNEEAARRDIEVNFVGPLHLMHYFSNSIIKNKNGAIVNIVSIAALFPFPFAATYCASKAALHSLTQCVRSELKQEGIAVFGVYPGPIDTKMSESLEVKKESPANLAIRVFNGMEQGIENITTDELSDAFVNSFQLDQTVVKAVEKVFN